ncbi:FAS1 domain-containing protein, partial [Colletotrichum chlorophyti]
VSSATAQLRSLPVERSGPYAPRIFRQKPFQAADPIGPAMPPSDPSDSRSPPAQDGVRLSDVMGRDRSINIFAGFTRDVESASRRLDDHTRNTTVLAPLNSAIDNLPRKPWEDPKEYQQIGEDAYEGDDGRDRAQRNIRRFVEAHMISVSPWPENGKAKAVGDDMDVWWETKGGTKFIQPGNIEVVSIASTVANGEVWIIKEVRNYA